MKVEVEVEADLEEVEVEVRVVVEVAEAAGTRGPRAAGRVLFLAARGELAAVRGGCTRTGAIGRRGARCGLLKSRVLRWTWSDFTSCFLVRGITTNQPSHSSIAGTYVRVCSIARRANCVCSFDFFGGRPPSGRSRAAQARVRAQALGWASSAATRASTSWMTSAPCSAPQGCR